MNEIDLTKTCYFRFQNMKSRKAICLTLVSNKFIYQLFIHPSRWLGIKYMRLYPWRQPVLYLGIVTFTLEIKPDITGLFGEE
jgi:hypothetical protein